MSKGWIAIVFASLVLFGGGALISYAHGGPGARCDRHGGHGWSGHACGGKGERLLHLLLLSSDLQLSNDQREQIRTLLRYRKEKVHPAKKKVSQAKHHLFRVTQDPDADEQAIRDAATTLSKAISEAAVMKAEFHARFREILTPEQHEQIKQFHGKQCDRHHKGPHEPRDVQAPGE